jgi:hypothetical protein
MTATPQPESKSTSRRALLAGALGGIGAFVAGAVGRASPVQAHDPDDVQLGAINSASSETNIQNGLNNETVFSAISFGSGIAIFGHSDSSIGIEGDSTASDQPAVLGWSLSTGNSTGVFGLSGVSLPAPKIKTGVYGYANQDSSAKGVVGESSKGYAGYFLGRVYVSKYQEMVEIATPNAPAANKARLFVRDSGGFTQLCVRFNTGGVKVLATQT